MVDYMCIYSENTRILYDIIFELKSLNKGGLLLLIDFEKPLIQFINNSVQMF